MREVVDMAVVPGAIQRIAAGGSRAVTRKHQLGDVLQVTDIRRGDHTSSARSQDAVDLANKLGGIKNVLDHLIGDDRIGRGVRQWKNTIQVRFAKFPAVRVTVADALQSRSGHVQANALIEPVR